jgi:hypothetical protein
LNNQIKYFEESTAAIETKIAESKTKIAESEDRIEQAQKMCQELVVFEPQDLAMFRNDYKVTVDTLLWKPLSLSIASQSWLYNNSFQTTFTKQTKGYRVNLALHFPKSGISPINEIFKYVPSDRVLFF